MSDNQAHRSGEGNPVRFLFDMSGVFIGIVGVVVGVIGIVVAASGLPSIHELEWTFNVGILSGAAIGLVFAYGLLRAISHLDKQNSRIDKEVNENMKLSSEVEAIKAMHKSDKEKYNQFDEIYREIAKARLDFDKEMLSLSRFSSENDIDKFVEPIQDYLKLICDSARKLIVKRRDGIESNCEVTIWSVQVEAGTPTYRAIGFSENADQLRTDRRGTLPTLRTWMFEQSARDEHRASILANLQNVKTDEEFCRVKFGRELTLSDIRYFRYAVTAAIYDIDEERGSDYASDIDNSILLLDNSDKVYGFITAESFDLELDFSGDLIILKEIAIHACSAFQMLRRVRWLTINKQAMR